MFMQFMQFNYWTYPLQIFNITDKSFVLINHVVSKISLPVEETHPKMTLN